MTYDIISTRKCRKIISITHPDDLFNFLKRYAKSRQEQFLVITLNGVHQVIGVYISTIGLVNKTIIHPREVFYHSIKDNAIAIAIAHNHPSGQLLPSKEDFEVTKNLHESSIIMGINFLDHIIFNKKEYFSMKQEGLVFTNIRK